MGADLLLKLSEVRQEMAEAIRADGKKEGRQRWGYRVHSLRTSGCFKGRGFACPLGIPPFKTALLNNYCGADFQREKSV